MAPLSYSPDTSISSHTLSARLSPMELQSGPSTSHTNLLANPLAFLTPQPQLNASFLAAAKSYLDPVAAAVSASQTQRKEDLRRKRKRGAHYDEDTKVLQLKKVHVAGFGVDQVFEQARKIIEATAEEIELSLPEQEEEGIVAVHDEDQDEDLENAEEYHSESSLGEEGIDWVYDNEEEDAEALAGEQEDDVDMEDEEGMFSDADADEDEDEDEGPLEIYQPDPNGLNDGKKSPSTRCFSA
jgi:U3 small nucleolar RNA-associated protein MPP10